MMEKVKVSKRLGIALDSALKVVYGDKERLLELGTDHWRDAIRIAINDLSMMELAEILVKGYEVEKTPAELLEDFKKENTNNEHTNYYISGVNKTIQFFEKNFEIKGINDK